ncbi:LytR/AlgR family response regulator transcription factor [Spongiimicrobium salis]|uniref:LytR/AlgR family response regulator transcription factor n=1 Tax=Spongiimicrobium salis TaxID=1667022 RepID=UPI00374CDA68
MKITGLIIDDEPLAISVIESYIQEFSNITIANVYHNPLDALADIESGAIDVIFLDINMPKMSGLEFLQNLKTYPLIIITTAYKEHAIESYELDVLDYLVKPIPFSRFLKSVNKLTNRLISTKGVSKASDFNQEPHIFLKIDKKLVKIILKEILFIESLKDYIKLHTTTGNHIAHKSLSSIIEELPSENFIRVHKSYAIAIDKVKSVEGNLVEIGNKGIPMGRNYIYHAKERILRKKS